MITTNDLKFDSSSQDVLLPKDEHLQEKSNLKFSSYFKDLPTGPNTLDKLYLTTNEAKQKETLRIMKYEPINGQVMLAVSGFFALNAAAVRGVKNQQQIEYLMMFDANKNMRVFWKEIKHLVVNNTDRFIVLDKIKSFLIENSSLFWPPKEEDSSARCATVWINQLEREVASGLSWLSSEKKFQNIKRIFDTGHFIFKEINLFNRRTPLKLAQIMRSLNFTFDTVYLSNIKEYAEKKERFSYFHQSLNHLRAASTDQTLIIDTETRPGSVDSKEPLKQRVTNKFVSTNLKKSFPSSPSYSVPVSKMSISDLRKLNPDFAKLFK